MTNSVANTRGAGLVPGAHRVIRVLDAGEGPYQGALVTRGEGVAVLADAESLSGWAGWLHAGDEHVAGPVDLVRRIDGHDVLLPWCTERITAFLGRRAAADAPLSAGEVSTLVASVLRGVDELGERKDGAGTGSWWLTGEGRPMFVIGAGDDAYVSAAQLIDRLQKECGDRALGRLLSAIRGGLLADAGRPRIPRLQLERWEAELLATAAPRALAREVHAPERARDIEITRQGDSGVGVAVGSRRRSRAVALGSPRDSPVEVMRSRLALVREASAALTLATRERWPHRRGVSGPPRSRRARVRQPRSIAMGGRALCVPAEGDDGGRPPRSSRRFVVAGAAAAVVLGGGLLWPVGATGEPSGQPSAERVENAAESPASSVPEPRRTDGAVVPTAGPTETDAPADAADPVSAAVTLISIIGDCADRGDEVCAAAVADGSAGIVTALQSEGSAGAEPDVGLVDHYGDVAVIRMSSATIENPDASEKAGAGEKAGAAEPASEQMLVLVRVDEKWLVRDVYSVADQPG